jgi:hypothetical protein
MCKGARQPHKRSDARAQEKKLIPQKKKGIKEIKELNEKIQKKK